MSALDDLRPSQWNALFKVVESEGFEPNSDVIRAAVEGDALGFEGSALPGLVHVSTRYSMAIGHFPPEILREMGGRARGPFGVSFTPGWDSTLDRKMRVSWEDVVAETRFWLRRVREDMGPSLWDLPAEERKLLTITSGEGPANTPFTPEERVRLGRTLDDVVAEVRRQGELNAGQFKLLTDLLDEAKKASERVPRRDWVMWVYGGLLNLGMSAAFAPTQAQHIVQLVGQAIHWVLTTLPLLPR